MEHPNPPVRSSDSPLKAARAHAKRSFVADLPFYNDQIPESALYNQLLADERRMDSLISRKRWTVADAMKRPQLVECPLQVNLSNTYERAEDGSLIGWTFTISGVLVAQENNQRWTTKARKFSNFVSKVYIEFERPEGLEVVQWVRSSDAQPLDGFQVKRSGQPAQANVFLTMDYKPQRFKLAPGLARLLQIHTDTKANIIAALWQYLKLNRLQDSQNHKLINNDPELVRIFGVPAMELESVASRLKEHLLPPDPVKLSYGIRVTGDPSTFLVSYHVELELRDQLEAMSEFLHLTSDDKDLKRINKNISQLLSVSVTSLSRFSL